MKRVLLALFFVLSAFSLLRADSMRFMQMPDASSDRLCFVYQGDLFVSNLDGSHPVRLVKAVGGESQPKFSPDGNWIAFTSSFNGNRNVYVIPVTGGDIRQVTFEAEGAAMLEWSNDGSFIYFLGSSASFSPFFDRIFKVPVSGGLPEVLPVDQASTLCFKESGDSYVLNRHSLHFWWWRRYKGSANTDVWLYDGASGSFANLTDTPFNESWPMWVGDDVYFVSEENGVGNLYRMNIQSRKREQVTNHADDDVQFPSLSSDRKSIVYECDAALYRFDIESGTHVRIDVPASVQTVLRDYEFVNPVSLLRTYDLSPTAKRVVFSARGEIFSAPAEHGEIRQLTFSSGARDDEPVWSPDGQHIAFISDMDGEENIYMVDQFAEAGPRKLTDRSAKFLNDLRWSPDGRYLSYQSNDFKLWVLDTEKKEEILVNESRLRGQIDYNWSPDSRWIVYTILGKNLLPEIHVFDLNEGEDHLVFRSFERNQSPVFSHDGKHLFFVTDRDGDSARIAMLSLVPEDRNPMEPEWDEEPVKKEENGDKDKTDKDDNENGKDKKKHKDKSVTVEIDFDGIQHRVRLLPVSGYRYTALQSAKEGLYIGFRPIEQKLQAKPDHGSRGFDLYLYKIEKEDLTEIASGISGFVLSRDGKKILLRKRSSFQIVAAGRKAGRKGNISLSSLTMRLDRRAEWKQIFDESWRMVRDQFYDPNLHGVDWDHMKQKYGRLIDYCQTRSDVNRVLQQLVGELNASHQGAGGGDMEQPDRVRIGALGAQLTPDKSGFYRFEKIYKGNPFYAQYQGPLDKPHLKVAEGHYLIAIDGNGVDAAKDYRHYLLNTVGRTVTLTVNDKPEKAGAWDIRVEPVGSEYRLRYLDWIESNRALVDEKSGGKLGYIHLNYMTGDQLAKFMTYIGAYFDKQGLILDVRFNGGGGIDPQLIDYLERRQYQVTRYRGGVDIPRPSDLFRGKVAVLCNEHSYSDAEVFPNAFRVRGLGKVIGVPTLGFVIAVGGYDLIDGGNIRRTHTGLWDVDGNQLESRGAIPDIIVENHPDDLAKGIDAQLNRAIEYLMDEIAKGPVFPDVETEISPR